MTTDIPQKPLPTGRTVEITDEDENILVAFIPVTPKTFVNR